MQPLASALVEGGRDWTYQPSVQGEVAQLSAPALPHGMGVCARRGCSLLNQASPSMPKAMRRSLIKTPLTSTRPLMFPEGAP